MLKLFRVNYLVNFSNSKKNIMKTFHRLAQRFGHIVLFTEKLNIEILKEMIALVKYLNVKITVNSDFASLIKLIEEDEANFLDCISQIDILGVKIEANIPNPSLNRLFSLCEFSQINLQAYGYDIKDINNLQYKEKFNKIVYYPCLFNQIENIEKLNLEEKVLVYLDDFYLNINGEFINNRNEVISHIKQSSKLIKQNLLDNSNYFVNKAVEQKEFPYKINKKVLQNYYNKIISGKSAFFDLEAVSRLSTNVAKHKIKDFPIPILYALIKIEKGLLKVSDKDSYSVHHINDLDTIYRQFFKYVKTHGIEYLVVSNGDLERRFIENAVYYLRDKLSIEDVRYLFRLKEQLIDIQLILETRHNSDKLLTELEGLYPDIITLSRKSDKLSIKINFILDGLIFGPKRNDLLLQKIINYCFEDVYADFALFQLYVLLCQHRLV